MSDIFRQTSELKAEIDQIQESCTWISALLNIISHQHEIIDYHIIKLQQPYDYNTQLSLDEFSDSLIFRLNYYASQPQHFKLLNSAQREIFNSVYGHFIEKLVKFEALSSSYKSLKPQNITTL